MTVAVAGRREVEVGECRGGGEGSFTNECLGVRNCSPVATVHSQSHVLNEKLHELMQRSGAT